MVTWLLKILKREGKHRKKSKTEAQLPYILEPTLRKFIMSREQEGRDILLEVYKIGSRKSFQLSFRDEWMAMEKVEKVEALVSIEKEIAGIRRDICQEMFDFSKGRM
tara:strand:+ start:183 stop:503 length:321 start_codon:yes stop_codon:yes gene_type:complete